MAHSSLTLSFSDTSTPKTPPLPPDVAQKIIVKVNKEWKASIHRKQFFKGSIGKWQLDIYKSHKLSKDQNETTSAFQNIKLIFFGLMVEWLMPPPQMHKWDLQKFEIK